MEEYQEQFGEAYFVSSFINGLKNEIRTTVKMLKFVKLSDAFDIDQLQEESLDVHKQNCKSNQKVEIDQKYSFYNSHEVAPANAYKIPLPNTFKKDFELLL